MLIIGCAFFVMLIVVFSAVMLATAPAEADEIIERRFWGVLRAPRARRTGPQQKSSSTLLIKDPAEQLQRAFRNGPLIQILRKLIIQSHVAVSVKSILLLMAALACVGFAMMWHFSQAYFLAPVMALPFATLPLLYLGFRRKKWLAAINAVLPECIDNFSRSLKAGQSIVASFDIVAQQAPAPANSIFADVFKKQRYGLSLREALYQMVEAAPSMDLKIMVTAILVQRETGGNLPQVLDRLSAVIRDRIRIRREVKTQTAQGRLTGWILGLLPPFLLLVISWINPGYALPLFHDPIGRYMLYTSAVLLTLGIFVIQRMVQGIEV